MENIGIDVHKKESQLCIITEAGEVIEHRIRTERGRFSEVLGKRPRAKVLMEASTESEWVARCLEEMGHEVVVADPNFAPMYGTRTRRVKTDKRDARALADACLSGTYRKAHRTSVARRQVKARLAVRDALVRERAKHLVLMGTLVAMHPTVTEAMRRYVAERNRDARRRSSISFFLGQDDRRLPYLHARLPWLSAYMGHDDLLGTETYLHTTPELLGLAGIRFRRRVQAGAKAP